MSVRLEIEMPEDAFSALRTGPEEFKGELLRAAVVKWHEIGRLSQSKSCEILGMSRAAFLELLHEFGVTPFHYGPDDLRREHRIL